MKFLIDINRAKQLSELTGSDIKVLFNLVDLFNRSGFVILDMSKKKELEKSLDICRQTLSNSLNKLYQLEYLNNDNGITSYNPKILSYGTPGDV